MQTHAGKAVEIAGEILNNPNITIDSFINDYHDILASDTDSFISLDKVISLINYRDNKIYIANPIYIYNKYFYYYLSVDKILKFDADELFFIHLIKLCIVAIIFLFQIMILRLIFYLVMVLGLTVSLEKIIYLKMEIDMILELLILK